MGWDSTRQPQKVIAQQDSSLEVSRSPDAQIILGIIGINAIALIKETRSYANHHFSVRNGLSRERFRRRVGEPRLDPLHSSGFPGNGHSDRGVDRGAHQS